MTGSTWPEQRLPPGSIGMIREDTPALVQNVLEAVRTENRIYAEVLEGPEGMAIRVGVEQAVTAFLTALERGEPPGRGPAELWRGLGEAEFRAGRSLAALRSAFRTGIRAAWRGAAEVGIRAGVSPQLVITMAEAIFVYADELATDVVEGYVRAQSDEAGEQARRRRRLAALLTDPAGHDPETLGHAADLAAWPLPRTLAAIAFADPPKGSPHPEAILGADDAGAFALLPDPRAPGRHDQLLRGLPGGAAALGPAVEPRRAADSLRLARRLLALAAAGRVTPAPLLLAEDHLGTLLVHADDRLGTLLVDARLGAIRQLPPRERDRLLATLRAWLDHQRNAPAVAAALHVHPQTVRYRVARLRELLGEGLEDAESRFELELALRLLPPAP